MVTTNGLIQEATELIDSVIEMTEAFWLLTFIPSSRSSDDSLRMFKAIENIPVQPDDLSYTSNKAISVYETSYSNRGEGMQLEHFARGAASAAIVLEDDDLDMFGTLLGRVLDKVDELREWPALDESFMAEYVSCLKAIVGNGEPMSQSSLLGYNAGLWWAMGHIKDAETVPIGAKAESLRDFVFSAFLDRASRGVLD